jgi:hypothetical protein
MKNITPSQVFNAIQNKLHPQPELPVAIKPTPSVEGPSYEQNLS